jgi:5-methylcytosine-specific restriction endonuclease McrA
MDAKHFSGLSDAQLISEVHSLAARERAATAALIAAIGEVDVRRLYLAHGYSSLFVFCTKRLHLSEHAAYGRITAARAARAFPLVLKLLEDGSLTLTSTTLLAPHLTSGNHVDVLRAAIHKSRREVEQQVAALRPRPAVAAMVRRLPAPAAAGRSAAPGAATRGAPTPSADQARTDLARPSPSQPSPGQHAEAAPALPPPRPAVVAPLSPERYKVQLTITRETHDKLRRVQDLMRHVVPDGDPAVILDRALTALLDVLEKRKLARARKPRPPRGARQHSRHVPADVKRKVWARDEGRCTFVGTDGRCNARSFLELHHLVPYADGGATDATNLTLRCRSHNQHDAAMRFGPWTLREKQATYELGSNRVDSASNLQPPTPSLHPPASNLRLPATIAPP